MCALLRDVASVCADYRWPASECGPESGCFAEPSSLGVTAGNFRPPDVMPRYLMVVREPDGLVFPRNGWFAVHALRIRCWAMQRLCTMLGHTEDIPCRVAKCSSVRACSRYPRFALLGLRSGATGLEPHHSHSALHMPRPPIAYSVAQKKPTHAVFINLFVRLEIFSRWPHPHARSISHQRNWLVAGSGRSSHWSSCRAPTVWDGKGGNGFVSLARVLLIM